MSSPLFVLMFVPEPALDEVEFPAPVELLAPAPVAPEPVAPLPITPEPPDEFDAEHAANANAPNTEKIARLFIARLMRGRGVSITGSR